MVKSLPTDAQIESAGSADAGMYMRELEGRDPHKYREFLEDANARGAQPAWRATKHLIDLIVRVIKKLVTRGGSVKGRDGGHLTQQEIKSWHELKYTPNREV